MEFVAAKCPNCAGELRLPDDKKQVKCMYCGIDVLVRDAINAAGVNVENLLKLAHAADKADNYQESYEYFTKVLEYEPENYTALLGKGLAAGRSSITDFRYLEVIEGAKAAVQHAPADKKEAVKIDIAEAIDSACTDFRMFKIKDNDEHAVFQRMRILECLELAHEYDPNNEDVLTSLYFENRQLGLTMKLLSLRLQIPWEEEAAGYLEKANEYLSKLSLINPEKSAEITKEPETQPSPKANDSDIDWATILGGVIGVAILIGIAACCFSGK